VITSFFVVFFFFSSRRRHTRFSRDWSSDVCSSDLAADQWICSIIILSFYGFMFLTSIGKLTIKTSSTIVLLGGLSYPLYLTHHRSEERRVGKECRSRWSRYH